MAESIEVYVRFEQGERQLIDATPVGPGHYRLDVTPLMVELDITYGDIIEAEPLADGTLRYLR